MHSALRSLTPDEKMIWMAVYAHNISLDVVAPTAVAKANDAIISLQKQANLGEVPPDITISRGYVQEDGEF